jgi:S-adenosylmethionine:tRNA ribosyltransferase-isomerase
MSAEIGTVKGGGNLMAEVTEVSPAGRTLVRFSSSSGRDVRELLEELGDIPLPPYIKRDTVPEDHDRYQTVFAEVRGSVAAPTAGLHFTEDLLSRLAEAGIDHVTITLHVGLATFQPLRDEDLRRGELGEEHFSVSEDTAARIGEARAAGGRVVAVGTTVVRALESAWSGDEGRPISVRGETRRFIHPPYQFRAVDVLITNFHLPRSSLILLASAFAGREPLLEAYREAVTEGYRFYSYGDAMLIE